MSGAIRRLPKEQREARDSKIIELRDEHGLDFSAIGERMGLTHHGARYAYHRVKRRRVKECSPTLNS